MKKLLMIFLLSMAAAKPVLSQVSQVSQTLQLLKGMDFNFYVNKPAKHFLTDIPSGYTLSSVKGPAAKKNASAHIILEYPGNVIIRIAVAHLPAMNGSMGADEASFTKENIYSISVYKNTDNRIREVRAP